MTMEKQMKCHICNKKIETKMIEQIGNFLCKNCFKKAYPEYNLHEEFKDENNL